MAYCAIKKNSEGKVSKVVLKNGDRSKLFDVINSIPQIFSKEEAISLYKNVLSSRFISIFGSWMNKAAFNPNAVKVLRNKLKELDVDDIDSVIEIANNMQSPALIEVIEIPAEYNDSNYLFYSANLTGKNKIFLIDDVNAVTLTTEKTLEPAEVKNLLNNSGSLNVNIEEYKALKPEQVTIDITNLPAPSEVSVNTYDNGEPKLFFLTPGGVLTEDYAEALRNTPDGVIKAGFVATKDILVEYDGNVNSSSDLVKDQVLYTLNNSNAFHSILEISSSRELTSRSGIINAMVQTGLLSSSKIFKNNEYWHTGNGASRFTQKANSLLAKSEIALRLGEESIRLYADGRLEFLPEVIPEDSIRVSTEGRISLLNKSQLKQDLLNGKFPQLSRKYDNMDIIAAALWLEDNKLDGISADEVIVDAKQESTGLKADLLSVLSSLGISVTGMTDYINKYTKKNNVPPSAKALADLGNQVVALAEDATVSDLAEETAHFLVETYQNQQEINDVLPEVENTPQWNDYAKTYYDIYGEEYSGDELTNMVRREVLGKILRDVFLSRNVTTSSNFLQRVYNIINNFINYIRDRFSGQRTSIDTLTSRIADLALAGDLNVFDTNLLANTDFALYSVDAIRQQSMIQNQIRKLDTYLANLKKILPSQTISVRSNLLKIKDIQQKFNDANDKQQKLYTLSAIHGTLSTAEGQINFARQAVKYYRKKVKEGDSKANFNPSIQQNIGSLNETIIPLLNELRGYIRNELDLSPSEEKRLIERIDKATTDMSTLTSDIENVLSQTSDKVIDDLMEAFFIPEINRPAIKKFIKDIQHDIWKITSFFGTLEHSNSAINGMLGSLISHNRITAQQDTVAQIKDFLAQVENGKWNLNKFENILQKDHNGIAREYLMSEIDFVKFEDEFINAQLLALQKAYSDILGNLSIEELHNLNSKGGLPGKFRATTMRPRTMDMSTDNRAIFDEEMDKFYQEFTERPYTDEYYQKRELEYEGAAIEREEIEATDENSAIFAGDPITEEAKIELSLISQRQWAVKSRFLDDDGKVNWSRLYEDESAVEELADIRSARTQLKSEYDPETGEIKTGISYRIAKDIQALDKYRATHMPTDRTPTTAFFETLSRIQEEDGSAAAFRFVEENGRLFFNNNFWESLDSNPSAVKLAEQLLEEGKDEFDSDELYERLYDAVEDYKLNTKRRKELLRQNIRYNNPAEIDYNRIGGEIANIRYYTTLIQTAQQDIYSILRSMGMSPQQTVSTESTVNQSYHEALKDSGLKEKKFMIQHMTDSDRLAFENFDRKISRFNGGANISLSYGEIFFIKKYYGLSNDLNKQQVEAFILQRRISGDQFTALTTEFGRSKLFPYFKRFAPKGFSDQLNDLHNGYRVDENGEYQPIDVVQFVRDVMEQTGNNPLYQYLDITLQNEWYDTDSSFEQYRNMNINSDYGFIQPRKDKFRNEEYFRRYAINSSGKATANLDEFNIIQNLVELKRQALENYDERNKNYHNLYKIPQVSKTSTERAFSAKGVKGVFIGIRDWIRDFSRDRVDDPLSGQTSEGMNFTGSDPNGGVRVLPKYYLTDLEEKSDVSKDLGRTYSMLVYQSNLYKQRANSIEKVMNLENLLLNSKFEGGKAPEDTNVYKMFKEWKDAYFYGVKMNRRLEVNIGGSKLDLSKMIYGFDKLVRYMNMGFNLPVALTGATTGQLTFLFENVVGQYIGPGAWRFGQTEMAKLLPGYLQQFGTIDNNNKLRVIGEHIGLYSLLERTHSAGFNRIYRTMMKDIHYMPMRLMSAPLSPAIMLAKLYDSRIINGQIITFNQFRMTQTGSSSEIRRAWDRYKDSNLYNAIEVENGKLKFKQDAIQKMGEGGEARLNNYMKVIGRETISLNQIAEGVLSEDDKMSASRHYLANFALAHRGWFFIAMQRAWKPFQYNFSTRQFEEGTYISLIKFIGGIYKRARANKGTANVIQAIKDEWNSLDSGENAKPWEKQNLKRVIYQLGMTALGIMMMRVLANFGDDDEYKDSWVAQMSVYVGLRTINEMFSIQEPFLSMNILEALDSPFVAVRQLKDLTTLSNYSFEEVGSGNYEGSTKIWRLIAKQTMLRHFYNIKSAENLKRSIDYWRILNRNTMFAAIKLPENE